jgi:hypothetical protein
MKPTGKRQCGRQRMKQKQNIKCSLERCFVWTGCPYGVICSDLATDWTTEESWFDSWQWPEIFIVSQASMSALGPATLFPRIRRSWPENDHSLMSSAGVENEWSYTSIPTCLRGVQDCQDWRSIDVLVLVVFGLCWCQSLVSFMGFSLDAVRSVVQNIRSMSESGRSFE